MMYRSLAKKKCLRFGLFDCVASTVECTTGTHDGIANISDDALAQYMFAIAHLATLIFCFLL
jgi:hypothetical protein